MGVITTFVRPTKQFSSSFDGSLFRTSSAAPFTVPASSASARAHSSISEPRATFIRIGFFLSELNEVREKIGALSGFALQCRLIISDVSKRFSRLTRLASSVSSLCSIFGSKNNLYS